MDEIEQNLYLEFKLLINIFNYMLERALFLNWQIKSFNQNIPCGGQRKETGSSSTQ